MIPKSFKIGSMPYRVSRKKNIDNDVLGMIDFRAGTVLIQDIPEYSESFVESTFYHELAHGLLDRMEEHKLKDDEKFCQALGNVIHEFMQSAKWENK